MDYSLPGSSGHGIPQARILEWVAIPFPIQGSNLGLLHCRQILYCLSHLGSPRLGSPKSKASGKDLSANGTFGRGFQEKSGSETGKATHRKGGVINQVTRGQLELFHSISGSHSGA